MGFVQLTIKPPRSPVSISIVDLVETIPIDNRTALLGTRALGKKHGKSFYGYKNHVNADAKPS